MSMQLLYRYRNEVYHSISEIYRYPPPQKNMRVSWDDNFLWNPWSRDIPKLRRGVEPTTRFSHSWLRTWLVALLSCLVRRLIYTVPVILYYFCSIVLRSEIFVFDTKLLNFSQFFPFLSTWISSEMPLCAKFWTILLFTLTNGSLNCVTCKLFILLMN